MRTPERALRPPIQMTTVALSAGAEPAAESSVRVAANYIGARGGVLNPCSRAIHLSPVAAPASSAR